MGSTVVGQAVDTVIVVVLLFAGRESARTIGEIILSGYFAKVIYEVLATPVTYMVVNFLKRNEGVDTFDRGVSFTPFKADV